MPSSSSPAAVDLFSQARKALSDRSPFDAKEAASRTTALPAALAAFLSKHSDGRKKHKKSHRLSRRKKSSRPSAAPTVWDQTEDYFRPLTLADIDYLLPGPPDSCLTIPVLGKERVALDTSVVEASSSSALIIEEQPSEKAELLDEDQVGKVRTAATLENKGDASSSMNWVMGSKHRFLLTTERPNKKHQLLTGNAELGQLLRLPHLKAGASEQLCDFCCLGPTDMESNRILCCDSCKVSVHQRCYGTHNVPVGAWLCSWCKNRGMEPCSRPCLLCPREGGALKPVGRDTGGQSSSNGTVKFAHLFCSLWAPEVYVENTRAMEPILNIGGVQETRRKMVCYLCKVNYGVCVRCSHGTCRTPFHPLCARKSKHKMEIWGKFDFDNVELRAFCSKHSSLHAVDHTSLLKPPPVILSTKKTILRINLGNKVKSMMQDEIPSSKKMVKSANIETGGEAELVKNTDLVTDGVTGSGNTISNSPDLVVVLRKLVDRGKVNVDDVASEMGISSNSLRAALLGKTTSLSPQLKLKIIKWLQDSAHILKGSSGSTISLGDVVARTDAMNASKFIPVVLSEDMKGEVDDKKSFHHDQDCCFEGSKILETIFEDTANPIYSSPLLDLPPGHKGNPDNWERNDSSDAHQAPPVKEKLSTFISGFDHADAADITAPNTLKNPDCDVDVVVSGDIIVSESCSSYVHPFIQRRLMQVQNYSVSEQKYGEACSNGHNEKAMLFPEDEVEVTELSPVDEVEGEMLYLQTRLLDRTVTIRHTCDDLIFRVVQNLPKEVDALNRREWDQTLVSLYLHKVGQAKKWGKKEIKHKKALAVLAAAAVAASSRNPSLRKDSNEGIISSHQEADSQQHGAKEVESLKQIRVKLEKVRLLCERIIRREKLKGDLALCLNNILASRRDYVAFSAFARSSFVKHGVKPGVNSESATTSLNNRSYSGTMQRSAEIKVDSTVVRPAMQSDIDGKTDDSSTSQLSDKRNFPPSSAGKRLPRGQASKAWLKSAEHGEQA